MDLFIAYITSHHTPTAGILVVTDIFGFEAPVLRKLVDMLTSYGCYVVVPDFFNKDPYNHQALDSVEAAKGVLKCILDKGLLCVGAVAIIVAEIDQTTPPTLAEKFSYVLKSKPEVESFVHIYPKVAHGWTCRYTHESPEEVANAAQAHKKMIGFGKYLH
ncbi:hypothetical protein KP509_1Z002700 [Ceratopteris richardii]|nr:hypothetical protein KP509_1Z002700 [Ceratopteris richardii]